MKKIVLASIVFLSSNSLASSYDIRPLQTKLQSYGYYLGAIDSIVNPELRSAIKQYLKDKEACPTNLDPKTCRLLMEFHRKYI